MARSSRVILPVLPLLALPLLALPLTAGCGGPSSGDGQEEAALIVDPCRPLALSVDASATTDQQAGALTAITWWNQAAGTDLAMSVSPGVATTVPVHFQVAASPSHGYFDPASGQVYINEDLGGHSLAVTIAHELGHAFGLVHVTGRSSVMNAGNLNVEPNAGDVAALTVIWGACPAAASGSPP